MNLLFYGSLRDHDILTWVTGPEILDHFWKTTEMPDWQAYYVEGAGFPVLLPEPNALVKVDLYQSLTEEQMARLNAYEGDDYRLEYWDTPDGRFYFYRGQNTLRASRQIWHLEGFQSHHKALFLKQLVAWQVPRFSKLP